MTFTRTRTDNNIQNETLESTGYIKKSNFVATPKFCETSDLNRTLSWTYPIGSYRTMTDCVVPNFRKLSAGGKIFNNPMYSNSYTRSVERSNRSYTVPYAPGTPSNQKLCTMFTDQSEDQDVFELSRHGGPVGHLDVPLGTSIQNLVNLAGTSASAAIDAPTFQSVVALAELRETLGFLRNPLKSLNRELTDVRNWKRRKRKLDRKTVAEVVSDNWLSYRYAVMPTIHDVRNLAEAVARTVVDAEPVRKTARGSASSNGSLTTTEEISLSDTTTSTDKTVTVRAGILYELQLSPNTFGVGTEQIPVALWEAIPLSFMVDWVLNIGSFIEAITPVAGVRRLASWTSIETEEASTRETWWARGGIHSNGQTRQITGDGRCTEKYNSTTKTRNPGIQIGLAHKISPLQGDLGKKRILDTLALAHQILVSK